MTYHAFRPPRELYEYGFTKDGPRPSDVDPSGFLIGWAGLDAHAASFVDHHPCELVVMGEWDIEGVRTPALGVNPDYMRSIGYERDGRQWKRS